MGLGLIFALLALGFTLVGSFFCLIAEASNDVEGKRTPKVTISVFVFGLVLSAFLAYSHFYPIRW